MNQVCSLFALALISISLAGCFSTTRGPPPIISKTGYDTTMQGDGMVAKFKSAADAASKPEADITAQRKMMKTGYALIYANCSDFFSNAGENQKWIIFTRDTVGAIGTLATGVMALHNASKNAVANVGFATAATFTGLDIYTKNFLFSAENVDSVRSLVLNALVVHKNAVGEHDDDSYESATIALLDNQDICSPMSIAALAKEAIKNGHVVAAGSVSDDLKRFTDAQDQGVLAGLGKLLHPPGPLTMSQASGLWWLLREQSTDEQRKGAIATTLKGIDADKSPLDANGVYKSDWPLLGSVNALLSNLSSGTQEAMKATVATASAPSKPAASANGAGSDGAVHSAPPPVAPAAALPEPRAAKGRRRVSVTVQ
jgi:hypothetical protein